MSELEIVLTELRSYREQHQGDMKGVYKEINEGKKCRTQMKLDHQELKGEVKGMRKDIKRIMEDMKTVVGSLSHHIKSKAEHFSQEIKDEGVFKYTWRKKVQIAITSVVVTLITVGGSILVAWLQSLV